MQDALFLPGNLQQLAFEPNASYGASGMLRWLVAVLFSVVFFTASRARADDASTLESGINSYEGSRYQECVQRFRAMLTAGTPVVLSDVVLRNRARMYYATCLTATKRMSEADEQMKQLVREDTRYIPDRAAFPGAVLDRFTEIRVLMKAEIERLERDRLQREELDARRRETERKRAITRLAKLESYARSETLVQQNSRWIALLPFGAGQFQNRQTGLAWIFLGTEAIFAATSIVTVFMKDQLEQNFEFGRSDSAKAEDRRASIVQVNRVSFAIFAALAGAGIVHANLTFVPEFRSTKERKLPPNLGFAPLVSPYLGGATLGVHGFF